MKSGCLGIKELPESFGNLTSWSIWTFHVAEMSHEYRLNTKLQYLNSSGAFGPQLLWLDLRNSNIFAILELMQKLLPLWKQTW